VKMGARQPSAATNVAQDEQGAVIARIFSVATDDRLAYALGSAWERHYAAGGRNRASIQLGNTTNLHAK
jgi:hypothetical protein